MFACVSCVLFTPPVAYKRIAVACERRPRKITDVLQNLEKDHHVDDPLQFVDEMLNSIATGFPVLDVGEFVGLDELENWALDHLFV